MKLQPEEEEEGEKQLGRLPGGGVFEGPFPGRGSRPALQDHCGRVHGGSSKA